MTEPRPLIAVLLYWNQELAQSHATIAELIDTASTIVASIAIAIPHWNFGFKSISTDSDNRPICMDPSRQIIHYQWRCFP